MRQVVILFGILSLLTIVTYGQKVDSVNAEEIIYRPEIMSTFPGGFEALMNFVKKNLKYPEGTLEYTGVVYVGFVIAEDGSPTDFKIMKGLCDVCDKNAIETLSKMPKWNPGLINGKPVSIRMVLPIKYHQ